MKALELAAGEQILVQTRRHWLTFARDALGILAIGAGLFALLGLMNLPNFTASSDPRFITMLAFAEVLWLLILWCALSVVWVNYYLNTWIVTNRRIINVEQPRLFSRTVASWQLETVRDVRTEMRNPLQSLFNYGLVVFSSRGAASPVRMEGMPHADLVSNAILHQIEKYRTLEETAKKQEILLHTVSHEVKAHLTKNEAVLSLIASGDFGNVPEKVKTIATTALQDTRKGVDMVMGILSSSDFKTGTMKFTFAPFDIASALQDVVSELRSSAEQKGISITVGAESSSLLVNGDEEKVRSHVARNLIENAIHYTHRGSIGITLSRVENAVLLAISDTGVGISAEDMPKLFTEGGKGTNSRDINRSSTGYGLFIAKQVVEAHGGVIWAKSDGPGCGSTFYVCFPAATSSPLGTNTV